MLLVQKMDPQLMKLLEVAYEAWMDTGIDVRSLRDSNRVGVYTGICGSEVGHCLASARNKSLSDASFELTHSHCYCLTFCRSAGARLVHKPEASDHRIRANW